MNDTQIVADASAVIALLVGEPFTRLGPEHLTNACIGAVNLSEVLARLQEIGMPEAEANRAVSALNLRVISFDEAHARAAARLRSVTRHAGLSLGDRTCLALGLALGGTVVTADRAWANVDVGVEIVLIR